MRMSKVRILKQMPCQMTDVAGSSRPRQHGFVKVCKLPRFIMKLSISWFLRTVKMVCHLNYSHAPVKGLATLLAQRDELLE